MTPPNIRSYFDHTADNTLKLHVILDACHMLKLVRNTLGSYGIMKDVEKIKINWHYIEQLHKFQTKKGLRLGNKLKSAHLQWIKQKMKVKLAAQTLSSSCRFSGILYERNETAAVYRV